MKFKSFTLSLVSMVILGWLISGCLSVNPTPALPAYQVIGTLTAQPSPSPIVLPDRSDELSCSQDSDCVLAYRSDQCCDCWDIYNQKTVDENRELRLLHEPPGTKYAKWRCPQKLCPFVFCAPCLNPPFGLVCDENLCRGAETWQEILVACLDLQQEAQGYCYGNAAILAYQSEGEEPAAKVCKNLEGNQTWGIPFSEDCLLQVARSMMVDDPRGTVLFCRSHMTLQQSNCLNEAALALGTTDMSAGLAVCNEIIVNGDRDMEQKDYCFHNLAMLAAKKDLVIARQICEMVSQNTEQCKLDAEQVEK